MNDAAAVEFRRRLAEFGIDDMPPLQTSLPQSFSHDLAAGRERPPETLHLAVAVRIQGGLQFDVERARPPPRFAQDAARAVETLRHADEIEDSRRRGVRVFRRREITVADGPAGSLRSKPQLDRGRSGGRVPTVRSPARAIGTSGIFDNGRPLLQSSAIRRDLAGAAALSGRES